MANKSDKQSAIEYQLRKVYEQIDLARDPVCTGCGRGDKPLSHSHTIARSRCKQLGKPELIFDPANIEIECFGTNKSCHDIWEYEGIVKRMELDNFDKKLEYIEKEDPEKFRSLTIAIKSVTEGLGNIEDN